MQIGTEKERYRNERMIAKEGTRKKQSRSKRPGCKRTYTVNRN